MNKISFLLGLVMIAAAVVAIYLEDATIRIICAAVFLICAVLLYFSLSNATEAAGEEAPNGDAESDGHKKSSDKSETLPLEFESKDGGRRESPLAESARQSAETAPPVLPYQRKEVTIPESYYRFTESQVSIDDPRAEFDFLIRKLVVVLKDLLIAHTVGLFWINRDRQQIVIGEFVTDGKNFTTMRRMQTGNDLISRVGESRCPEVVTDIPPAAANELLIYYDAKEGIRSFVGVPVFFQDEAIAVLAADSKVEDAFGVETVATMGNFTSLVSVLLRSYNQKYDLDADSKLLQTLNRMRKSMQLHPDAYGIATAAANAAAESLDWDYIAIVQNDEKKQTWIVGRSMTKSGNEPYIQEGTAIDADRGVVGRLMQEMKSRIIHSPAAPEYRYTESERIQGNGQMCLMPLLTPNRCFGSIVVEYKEKHQYGDRDLEILQRIAETAASALEILSLNDLTRNYLLIDETTRVGSRAMLIRRLQEERVRAIAHGGEVCFFLIAVDQAEDITEKHGRHATDLLLTAIARTVQSAVKPYDVVGKFDQFRFGALLLYTGSEHALLQGEKIRKAIAGTVVAFGGTSFSATVSIGGAVLTQSMEIPQIVKVVQQAVERATVEGGNCVKIV